MNIRTIGEPNKKTSIGLAVVEARLNTNKPFALSRTRIIINAITDDKDEQEIIIWSTQGKELSSEQRKDLLSHLLVYSSYTISTNMGNQYRETYVIHVLPEYVDEVCNQ